ncbi:MAG: hypothetical protein KGL39_32150 [Patescibacteria group bacterium]|nr:hypothetical protein [Patescibacteria group bacterium]
MPYSIRRVGNAYEVVNTDTGEVHAKHTTKKKAEAQVRLLEEREGFKPDKVVHMSDGTKVNVKFKNKEKYSGTLA